MTSKDGKPILSSEGVMQSACLHNHERKSAKPVGASLQCMLWLGQQPSLPSRLLPLDQTRLEARYARRHDRRALILLSQASNAVFEDPSSLFMVILANNA
jgi:hypothetical protein